MKKGITVGLIPDTPSNRQSLNYDLLLLIIIIIIITIIILLLIMITFIDSHLV